MSAYADPPVREDVPDFLTSDDISKLFKREPGWFDRGRVRSRLYAKGFPHPVERDRWSPLAVMNWMEAAGENVERVPPGIVRHKARQRRPSRPSRSGYTNT